MTDWKIKQTKNIALNDPILIEGLPGIGNVGKIAVDFLIDELKAKKIYEIHSRTFPHSVFINERNLIEMPKIEIYYKKAEKGKNDYLFLAGDVQPSDEVSCYHFSEEIIKICRKHGCKDIITIGGIGLADVPKKPKIFYTGNKKSAIEKYKDKNLNNKLYGVVGPIVGVSGLLLGIADKNMNSIALLAETYAHPMYLGVKGAKEVLSYLNKKFKFGIDIIKLDKEIKEIEDEILKKTEEIAKLTQQAVKKKPKGEISYIG
jgi:hypothetical protein